MKANTTRKSKANARPNERGRKVRVGFDNKGIVRPMERVNVYAQDQGVMLSDKDKQAIRLFLLGRAPKSMPERLMVIAEQALSMTPVMTTTNAA